MRFLHRFPRAGVAAAGAGLLAAAAVLLAPALAAQATPAPRVQIRSAWAGAQLGLSVRDLNQTEVTRQEPSARGGVYVEDVRQGGAAAEAGFQTGDIVVSFDGERVRGARHLARLVDETPAGREVESVVLRGGSRLTLTVAPEQSAGPVFRGDRLMPNLPNLDIQPFVGRGEALRVLPFARPQLGVTLQELTDQLAAYFGTADGVLVTSVASGTPAEAAGLKAGDVITKIGDATVDGVADIRSRVGQASGQVSVTVVRDRQEQTLSVTLDDERQAPVRRQTI